MTEVLPYGFVPAEPVLPADEVARGLRETFGGRLGYQWSLYPTHPATLRADAYAELATAAERLLDLLVRTVRSLGGTASERARRLGMDPRWDAFFTDAETEDAHLASIARPDVLVTAEGFRFIEYNVSAALGLGEHHHLLARAWRGIYGRAGRPVDDVLADPYEALAGLLSTAAKARGVDRRVAILSEFESLDGDVRQEAYELERAHLTGSGLDVEVMSPADFTRRRAAAEFPLVLRHMSPFDWARRGLDLDLYAEVSRAPALVLLPHSSYLVANKKTLALLSAAPTWLTADEADLVRRYVPWTRIVAPGDVEFHGGSRDLPGLVRERRRDLVLKEATSNGGQDVVMGDEVPAADWERLLGRALDSGNWVVQERVVVTPFPVRVLDAADGRLVDGRYTGLLSPFLIGGREAGITQRFSARQGGLVSLTRWGAQVNGVLPVDGG